MKQSVYMEFVIFFILLIISCNSLLNSQNESKQLPTEEKGSAFVVYNGALYVKDKMMLPDELIIPSKINEDIVTKIGRYAFSECNQLISVIIPDTVEIIDDGAFFHCANLTSIHLPDSVNEIGIGAFEECVNLYEITIPHNLTKIEYDCFRGCSELINVFLPASLEYIGENAFYNCLKLSNISLPDSVEYIGDSAFKNCQSLEDINLPSSLEYVGENAFSGCFSLGEIVIPNSVRQSLIIEDDMVGKSVEEVILILGIPIISGDYEIDSDYVYTSEIEPNYFHYFTNEEISKGIRVELNIWQTKYRRIYAWSVQKNESQIIFSSLDYDSYRIEF